MKPTTYDESEVEGRLFQVETLDHPSRKLRGSAKGKRLLRRVLRGDPAQDYLLYVPSSRGTVPPIFVAVHGTSRNVEEYASLFSAYSEMYGAVLVVPHFSAEQHPDYQRLGRNGRGKRADAALNLIVAEAAEVVRSSGDRFYLFGYSGGAQFAHRYTMAHPHRVASAVFASAGWYSMPDPTRRFPYGTRPSRHIRGLRFDAEEYLQVPMKVLVGTKDDQNKGLRRSERLDRDQGATRVERARNWVAAMKAMADAHHIQASISYEEIENCDHSFRRSMLRGGLGDRVFAALFGAPPSDARASDV